MKILIFAGLSDKKFASKMLPVLELEKIERAYLVRNHPFPHAKVVNYPFSGILNVPIFREILKTFVGIYLVFTKKIDYVLGIYLIPHGLLAYLVGKVTRKRVVQLIIGDDSEFIKRYRKISGAVLRQAWKIGVRGEITKKLLLAFVENVKKIFIQHNVYQIPPIPENLKTVKKEIDILSIGNFTRVKRVDRFLEIIGRLKGRYPGIKAVFVGNGPKGMKTFYVKKRDGMGLRDNVEFTGFVEDVSRYYQRSKVFIMTSDMEGLPMAMIEAMTWGLPCVLPDVGNIPDIAKDGYNAFVVKPHAVDQFAGEIEFLLDNNAIYEEFSVNAMQTVKGREEEFSLPYIQHQWEEILQ